MKKIWDLRVNSERVSKVEARDKFDAFQQFRENGALDKIQTEGFVGIETRFNDGSINYHNRAYVIDQDGTMSRPTDHKDP